MHYNLPLLPILLVPALDHINHRIQQVQRLGLYRYPRTHHGHDGAKVRVGDRWLVNFSSNDYLGLAQHPVLKVAAVGATQLHGTGSGASRLVTGSSDRFSTLERTIADWKATDDAVVFNSGYQANIGVLGALTKRGDCIFFDALAHASLRDGIGLSRANAYEFPHNDVAYLETLLQKHTSQGVRAIVTESVFSMDGDLAPLASLLALARSHDCLLIVDEAHSVGVFGHQGAGLCAQLQLHDERLIQVGTCGKALGSFGAYIACCLPVAELLRNRARSFIYTTALPPATVAATQAAIAHVCQNSSHFQQQLLTHRRYLEERLGVHTHSQIVPMVLGSSVRAQAASQQLEDRGFWVQAIRPPTVPHGTARLRISLSAIHTVEQLDTLCTELQAIR
ncbi:MAG: 8-amino-7-oxononanoate synthase [Cyanobacteria bacterium P01_E01_bin.34]